MSTQMHNSVPEDFDSEDVLTGQDFRDIQEAFDEEMERCIKVCKDKIINARIRLFRDAPFWSTLAVRLGAGQPTLHVPTFATDGINLYFNPLSIVDMPKEEIMGCLVHEVFHVSNGHIWREGKRDHERWNIACDYFVNWEVISMGYKLPKGIYYDAKYQGMSSEEIYNKMPKDKGKKGGKSGGQPSRGCGDFMKPKNATKGQIEDLKREWENATIRASEIAQQRGSQIPPSMQRQIDNLKHPPVNWRSALLKFAQDQKVGDYSWLKPNWRYLQLGILLPGIDTEAAMGPMVVGWDTSGSVGRTQTSMISQHMHKIIQEVCPSITYIAYCDAIVRGEVEEFTDNDEIKFNPRGGGGTDFRPVFNWVEQQDMTPACLIYFTDLEGTFPQQEVGYPVLWASFNHNPKAVAPWGQTIHIQE